MNVEISANDGVPSLKDYIFRNDDGVARELYFLRKVQGISQICALERSCFMPYLVHLRHGVERVFEIFGPVLAEYFIGIKGNMFIQKKLTAGGKILTSLLEPFFIRLAVALVGCNGAYSRFLSQDE